MQGRASGEGRREEMVEEKGKVTEKSNLYSILSTCHVPLLQTAPPLSTAMTDTVRAFLKHKPSTKLSVVGRRGAEMETW